MAVVNAVMEHNQGILQSQKLKATLRNERLSNVSEQISNRIDITRSKRKTNQDEYRHAKRLKRCAETKTKNQPKSKDYVSGGH